MKIFYFNDRQEMHRVYVDTLDWNTSILFHEFESKYIEVPVPEDHNLFVKVWSDGTTLIASTDMKDVANGKS